MPFVFACQSCATDVYCFGYVFIIKTNEIENEFILNRIEYWNVFIQTISTRLQTTKVNNATRTEHEKFCRAEVGLI